jgi:hypothetical protein
MYDLDTKILSAEIGTPISDTVELFASLGYIDANAGMETWTLSSPAPEPEPVNGYDLLGFVYDPDDPGTQDEARFLLDWSNIHTYTNVDVARFDFGMGARWRSSTGYGLELSHAWTDYTDRDPILEDETGQYSRLMGLISKSS